jgi:hypothetical protein
MSDATSKADDATSSFSSFTNDGTTSVDRETVPGACPECGTHDLKRYPVLALGGWFIAVKCQACLASLSRKPWKRLGWVDLEEDRFL